MTPPPYKWREEICRGIFLNLFLLHDTFTLAAIASRLGRTASLDVSGLPGVSETVLLSARLLLFGSSTALDTPKTLLAGRHTRMAGTMGLGILGQFVFCKVEHFRRRRTAVDGAKVQTACGESGSGGGGRAGHALCLDFMSFLLDQNLVFATAEASVYLSVHGGSESWAGSFHHVLLSIVFQRRTGKNCPPVHKPEPRVRVFKFNANYIRATAVLLLFVTEHQREGQACVAQVGSATPVRPRRFPVML